MSIGLPRPTRVVWLALMGALLFAAAGAVQVRPAEAQVGWCWDDPIIEVNGQRININVGVQGSPALVKRHVQHAHVTIYVPRGSDYRLVDQTAVYFPETVEFVEVSRAAQIGVVVEFTATRDLPAMMVISSQSQRATGAFGSINTTAYGSTYDGVRAIVGRRP
jgi:hypothetical protein